MMTAKSMVHACRAILTIFVDLETGKTELPLRKVIKTKIKGKNVFISIKIEEPHHII